MSKNSRILRDQSGSTIVEFAILAPAIIGLLFGVFQVGLGMQAKNSMRSIAQETARYAVVARPLAQDLQAVLRIYDRAGPTEQP